MSASLLRSYGLLLLQAVPHVRPGHLPSIPAGAPIDDFLRHHHPRVDRDHHHQRLHLCAQLQPRVEAAHQQEEGSPGGEDHRTFLEHGRPSPITDDDRLIFWNQMHSVFHQTIFPALNLVRVSLLL